jgi:arylsulfatase
VFIHGAGGIGQRFSGSLADFPPNQVGEGKYFDNVLLHNNTIVQTKGYCTDVFFQAALGWIKQQHDSKAPYFVYLVPNAPHGPMIAPPKNKNHFLDMGFDEETAGRYGMVENLDKNMGLFMKKMDEWNAWDNTLVIFITDNGQGASSNKYEGMILNGKEIPLYTAGFKSGKLTPYEGGTHVPAFWRWKGVLSDGVDISALTAHIDLYKTFCELAGVKIPKDIQKLDGRSMVPLLEDPEARWPDRELFFHCGRWPKGSDPDKAKYEKCAVRTQRWRFVNNNELYDIANDPYETTNVIDKYPKVVKKLRKAYDKWWVETLPLMVNEDVPLAKEHPQEIRYYKQVKETGIPEWVPPEI